MVHGCECGWIILDHLSIVVSAFGDGDESKLISEVFNSVKSLLTENTSDKVSLKMLQEHANGLQGIPKDIFEDFVLYLNLTDIDSRLL
jgi:hypothetical protein